MLIPWALDGVRALSANGRPPKVIAVLREPIDRFRSDYWHEASRQQEARSPEDAFLAETTEDAWFWEGVWPKCVAECSLARIWTDRPGAGHDPFDPVHFRHPPLWAYARRGHYIENLRPWLREFGPETLLVLSHEELAQDTLGTMNKIFDWLGLARLSDMDVSPQNVAATHSG